MSPFHRLVCTVLTVLALPVAAQDPDPLAPAPPVAALRGAPQPGRRPVGAPFPTRVVFTNIVGQPTADVPGLPGAHFQPGTGSTHFDRVFGSKEGQWILSALTDRPTTQDEIILVNETFKIAEGDVAPWAPAETVGLIDTRLFINDAGEWVFATNSSATVADEYVVKVVGTTYTAAAREGDPVPGITGATWGATLETPVIASTGTVGFSSDTLLGVPTTEDEVLVLGPTILGREGITVPTGQLGAEFWENFDLDDYWISADGAHWLAQGDLTGATATDGVVVVDGGVVVQEGVVLPGSGFPEPVDLTGIVGVHMDAAGNWLVRGNNDLTEQDWVYRNGAVVAQRGGPIHAGATELWSDTEFADCFFLNVGNSRGDFVIGGVSDGPTATNGLLVLNATRVIVREGDPVDLNGNGLPDDDAFFNTFGNDDAHLTRTGLLYIVATMRNGAGTVLGQGVFEIDVSEYVPVELSGFTIN